MVPDIKKLIAGFLLFASTAAVLSLGLSSLLAARPVPPQNGAGLVTSAPTATENAFAPQGKNAPRTLAGAPADDLLAIAPAPSVNLTERLGNLLAQEIIRMNDAAGTLNGPPSGLAIPAKKNLEAAIQDNIAKAAQGGSFLPRFDEPVPDRTLRVVKAPREEDFLRYMDEAARTLSTTIGSDAFTELIASAPSVEAAYTATAVYGNAAQNLARLSVPEPLAPFHKSVLAAVRNRKALVDLALGSPSDPLKSLAALESLEGRIGDILARDLANFEREANRLRGLSFSLPPDTRTFAERLFGIERAFAEGAAGVVPVNDAALNVIADTLTEKEIEDDTRTWFQKLWDIAQKALLQELKNQLIRMLELQIVNWINGGGSPQFVTDWKGFLGDAFNNAAGAVIEKVLPELCQPISPLLRVTFTLPSIHIPAYTGCTLNQVVDNVKNFYQDFRKGGWIHYGVVFEPSGNYFGALIEGHDRITKEAIAAATAAKNKATAGKGFLSIEKCPSTGKPPDPKKGCPGGEQPLIQTPGSILGDTLAKGLTLPAELIVNADDIAGLVTVVANAALNRLVTLGIDAVSGKPTGEGLRSITYAAEPPANSPEALCRNVVDPAARAQCVREKQTESLCRGIADPTARAECVRQGQNAANLQGRGAGTPPGSAANQPSCSAHTDPTLRANCEATQKAAEDAVASLGELGTTPQTFAPRQLASKVDLSNICAACVAQSHTQSRNDGNGPARAAIDGSTHSFSSTYGRSPAWWEVELPTPQRLDEIDYVTAGGYTMSGTTSNTNPLLVLYEATATGAPGNRYSILLPPRLNSQRVNLATERMRDANGKEVAAAPNTLYVKKVRFEANQLLLAEVELFRHMFPEVDISKVPSSIAKTDALNLDPLQWVSAIYYPTHDNPQPAPPGAKVTVEVFENTPRGSRIEPLDRNPLRYRLEPGGYRFIYTAEVNGEISAPTVRVVTIRQ
jgi:hypothetical protein